MEVAENDLAKTAFTTHEGLFEFTVMPFSLCNVPATFQCLMSFVLAGVKWSQCLVYLDDIIVLGRNFNEHLKNLGIVLQKLKDANLRLKPAKCALYKTEGTYLGHKISRMELLWTKQRLTRLNTGHNQRHHKNCNDSRSCFMLSQIYPKFCFNCQATASSYRKGKAS